MGEQIKDGWANLNNLNIIPGYNAVTSAVSGLFRFFNHGSIPYALSDHCPDHLLGQSVGEPATSGAEHMLSQERLPLPEDEWDRSFTGAAGSTE